MATHRRKGRKAAEGRGSAEAVQKRRTARRLNEVVAQGERELQLDGRTDKRRRRLLAELKEGKAGAPLKPIDVVSHVHELLELGESLASLRKQGVKPRKPRVTPELLEVVGETQRAYGFRPEAWRMLGLKAEQVEQAAATASTEGRGGRGRGAGGSRRGSAGKRRTRRNKRGSGRRHGHLDSGPSKR